MTSRTFSPKTKRAAFTRANGHCESCGRPFSPGAVEYDHIIAWELSQDSSLENCDALCPDCHLKKTAGYDIPVIAKCNRIADKRMGLRKSGKPLPGGRKDWRKKKLNGEVVKRLPRYAEQRAFIARRQIGGCDDQS